MNIVKKSIFIALALTSLGAPQGIAAQGLKERVVAIKEKVKKVVTPGRVIATAVIVGVGYFIFRQTVYSKTHRKHRDTKSEFMGDSPSRASRHNNK